MKKIATLALASMITTAAVAVPLESADAHGGWAGFGLGFLAGAVIAPYFYHPYYYHPYYYHPYYYHSNYAYPYSYGPYHHHHHHHHQYYSNY
jgi:hypothetical protein